MEGLIKGLADVAFGGGDEDNSSSRDERSRSTWATVVSGEEDDQNRAGGSSSRRQNLEENQWEKKGERVSTRHSQKDQEENRYAAQVTEQQDFSENQKEEDNDGWETVGKKKPARQSHKVQKEQWQEYKGPASEQHYSDDVETQGDLEPSQLELSGLSEACNKLWELDYNRLVPGNDYQIDCGDGKRVHERSDMAQGLLFSWVSDEVFRKPTFARFCSLLDNYNPNEGYKEVVTEEERQEQAAFIEEISRTAPIKYLHKYLVRKDVAPGSYQEFKRMLTSLWFDLYGRGGTSGSSSAFEHVFVGEIKQSGGEQVSGFHNWLQFYLEEAKGTVDYQGYIFPRRRGEIPDAETQLLTIQFEWNGVLKSVSSTLVGVSPEFELALYTMCFFMGREENHIQLGPYNVNVKCYRLGNNRIGSAFPIAES
uniref:Poly(U)-specific endoribonuclease-B n=1 Tax=Noccaea caerulescens TaxID=107243 RepID=A0A1J3HAT7_NOCCA